MTLDLSPTIAHRGASAYFPENTLLAMEKAGELGANWVEFDVNVSKDNIAIVFHDEDLQRIAKITQNISELNYQQIKEIDAGSWFNSAYSNLRIPTLSQVLQLANKLQLNLNIELKPSLGREEDTVLQTLKEIKTNKIDYLSTVLFSSFSMKTLRILREHCRDCHIGLLFDKWDPQWQELVDELNAESIHLNKTLLNSNRIIAIKQKQLKILVYTVNSAKSAESLYKQGIDAVFSDYPELLTKG